MNVSDAIDKRRSVRQYLDEEVDEATMEKILHAGLRAPSAMNKQQTSFVVCRNHEVLDEISKMCVASFPEALSGYKSRFADKSIFYNAPIVVFVHADHGCPGWEIGDSSISMAQMCLQATELGIGSCIIGLVTMGSAEAQTKVKELLSIPQENQMVAAVIFGKPKYDGKAPAIKEGRVSFV
ncbi:hypothetical protein GEMRC1_011825 [Eukaryota sp. GEM-RC1]